MSTREPKSDRLIDVGIGALLLGACASGWVVSVGRVYPNNLFDIAHVMETFNLHSEIACAAASPSRASPTSSRSRGAA